MKDESVVGYVFEWDRTVKAFELAKLVRGKGPRSSYRCAKGWRAAECGNRAAGRVPFVLFIMKLEVTQIIGPVVDVQLKSSVPAWRILTPVRVAQSIRAGHVTVEVQHLLGGGIFRSVAMQGTQGLRRGDPAELLPGPISVPVGRCTLGRIFNVLGEPVDGKGPVKSELRRPIHRSAPSFIELDTKRAIFETGKYGRSLAFSSVHQWSRRGYQQHRKGTLP